MACARVSVPNQIDDAGSDLQTSLQIEALASAEGTLRFVIPAKAGIQANSAGKQTWIPAWRGNDNRGSLVREHRVMKYFVMINSGENLRDQ